MWFPGNGIPRPGSRRGPLVPALPWSQTHAAEMPSFSASTLGPSQLQQVSVLFLHDCPKLWLLPQLGLRCPCVPCRGPAPQPSWGGSKCCSALLFSSRGEVSGAGVWPIPLEPSPDELPRIASLLLPAVPRKPRSETALVRSEMEPRVGAGPHGPRERTCPPSQVSSPEPGEALPGPRPRGGSRGSCMSGCGESCAECGLECSADQQPGGEVRGRPWDSPQGAPILKEEWGTQDLDLPSLKERRTHEPYLQENPSLRGEGENQARSSGGP